MGFFDTITKAFTGVEPPSEESTVWNIIHTEDDINAVIKSSFNRLQIVYKHSPSCGVSYFALRNLNDPELLENPSIDFHLIDVISERSVSKNFAEKVNVRHESPQIFVLNQGEVIWHDSHNSVSAKNVLSHI
mgnify:FL=1|jgi:bacillithiol system protein YtxJ